MQPPTASFGKLCRPNYASYGRPIADSQLYTYMLTCSLRLVDQVIDCLRWVSFALAAGFASAIE